MLSFRAQLIFESVMWTSDTCVRISFEFFTRREDSSRQLQASCYWEFSIVFAVALVNSNEFRASFYFFLQLCATSSPGKIASILLLDYRIWHYLR